MSRTKFLFSAVAVICGMGLLSSCEKNPAGNGAPNPGATSNGYFVITHPSSGDSLDVGIYDSILWTAIPGAITGSYVSIRLCYESVPVYSIDTYDYNDGVYYWTVPSTVASGDRYHIKIAGYSDTNQYDFGGYFTIIGIDPDAYEFDNVRDSAKTAASGVMQQHTITYADSDWVRIPMDSGKTYIIQDSGVSAFRTYLYLYYGTETSNRSYNYVTSSGVLTWQYACIQTGTYYLKVYPYYSGYTGSYTLRVTEFDPQTSVAFGNPTSASIWAAGSSYTINWTPDAGLLGSYVNFYLYKGNQPVYPIYTSGASNSGTYAWTIPSGVATGSDYQIRIENYYTPSIHGYSQNFTISGVTADAYEFDNLRDSAKTAISGLSQQHSITYGDTDWVRFTADSGSTYVFRVATGSYVTYPTCLRFYLYFGTETSYTYYTTAMYSSGTLNYVWQCTRSGTWLVKMYPYSTTYLGNYSFRQTKIDSTSATFVNPSAGAVWSAGTAYTINWSADTGIFSSSITLYLYKGNSSVYTIDANDPNDGSFLFTVPAGLATGSDYRIRIANYSYSSIYAFSPAFSISGIAPDAYEYDDTAGAAKPIATDGTAQGRTLTLGDYDWISFTAERDSMYVLQGSGGSTVYLYLYLYSSPTTSVTYAYGYTPKIAWTCPASGTYYLRLYPSGSYGSYSVSVRKYSVMSSVTFANPSAGAAWTTGSAYTINWSADTALFGSYVNLYLAVDTTVLSTIVTYRTNTQGGSTYSWTPPAGLATGSRYRIKLVNYSYLTIAGFSDTFTISGIAADAYEPDNSSAAAHTIATNGIPEGHTITLGDKDWYRFTATANLLYVLQGHGSIRPAMYLYNTDGTTVITSANTGYTDTAATVVWMCPATGTYFFRDTATGSYGYGSYQAAASVYDSAAYSLTVTAPAASDSLTTGQTDTIQWSSAVSIGGNVDIFLYNSAGIVGTVVANIANSGSYSWTVAGTITPGDTYYVRVISRVYSSISGNSGVFKIGAP